MWGQPVEVSQISRDRARQRACVAIALLFVRGGAGAAGGGHAICGVKSGAGGLNSPKMEFKELIEKGA
jgi:hypothetical protein